MPPAKWFTITVPRSSVPAPAEELIVKPPDRKGSHRTGEGTARLWLTLIAASEISLAAAA